MKTVITAVVVVVVKEGFSWFIRTTRTLAVMLRSRVIPWINRDAQRFDLILQGVTCMFFLWLFIYVVPAGTPVTHNSVRALVVVGGMLFLELYEFAAKLGHYAHRFKGT